MTTQYSVGPQSVDLRLIGQQTSADHWVGVDFCHLYFTLDTGETDMSSDCAMLKSVINLCKHPVSILRGCIANQNY